jgi:acetyl-CoA carboxylase carboxyl transferase subunit alpha
MMIDYEELEALRTQIEEIRAKAQESGIDVTAEVRPLETQLDAARKGERYRTSRFDRVKLARNQGRPFTLDFIDFLTDDWFELRGDRNFRDDPAIVGGWGKIDGSSALIIGHQKGREMKENLHRNFGSPHPEGYRKAKRLMKLAEKFNRPVVTLIDTQGAYPGVGAEERGQGEAIADNLFAMAGLRVPIVSCVIGEGGSGGALGIGLADRVLMMENAVYSVISPEGCAAILWRSRDHADVAAEALKLTATDLLELGVIDEVIPEPRGGAHNDPETAINAVGDAIKRNLRELAKLKPDKLLEARRDKYYGMGVWEEA